VIGLGAIATELGLRCAAAINSASSSSSSSPSPGVGHGGGVATLSGVAAWLALRRGDIPPSAIDFHCSNVLDTLLLGQRIELRRAVLAAQKASLAPRDWQAADNTEAIVEGAKSAMWVCSSSINNKAIVTGEGRGGYYDGDPVPPVRHARVWAVLEDAAVKFQRGVVHSRVPPRSTPK